MLSFFNTASMIDKTDDGIFGPGTQLLHSFLNYCRSQFYPLWVLDCKDKARQKCKTNKKTIILEKYPNFHTARN